MEEGKMQGPKDSGINLADKKLPDCFPQGTRKFVEVNSGEVLYLKETGETFYQKATNENLILISDLK
jgi:hypothetical protein